MSESDKVTGCGKTVTAVSLASLSDTFRVSAAFWASLLPAGVCNRVVHGGGVPGGGTGWVVYREDYPGPVLPAGRTTRARYYPREGVIPGWLALKGEIPGYSGSRK